MNMQTNDVIFGLAKSYLKALEYKWITITLASLWLKSNRGRAWLQERDLNPRSPIYEMVALPNLATLRYYFALLGE